MNNMTQKLLEKLEFYKNPEGKYTKTIYLKDAETIVEEWVEESSTPDGFRTFVIKNDQNDLALDIGTYAEMYDPWEVITVTEFSVFLNASIRFDVKTNSKEKATELASKLLHELEEDETVEIKIIDWVQEEILPICPDKQEHKPGKSYRK